MHSSRVKLTLALRYAARVAVLLSVFGFLLYGCGGGGGGGGGGATGSLSGTVLNVDTNGPLSPAPTLSANGVSVTAGTDGKFSLTGVPVSATTLSIAASGMITRPLPITVVANKNTDLGNVFLTADAKGYTAIVKGRIVTTVSGASTPVGNATVVIAGAQTQSKTDGTFEIDNLPVGLGNAVGTVGQVIASGFETKFLTDDSLLGPLATGVNNIGDVLIAKPVGTTPPPPYTVTGLVVNATGGAAPGVQVNLASGGNNLGLTITDANGAYFFWVVPAVYNITASATGFPPKTVSVTLQKLDTPVTAPTITLTP